MLHLLIKDMFQLNVFIMLLFYKCKWQFYEGEEKYYVLIRYLTEYETASIN